MNVPQIEARLLLLIRNHGIASVTQRCDTTVVGSGDVPFPAFVSGCVGMGRQQCRQQQKKQRSNTVHYSLGTSL